MRFSSTILMWSAVSGVIIGLFIDALMIGAAIVVSALVPGARILDRLQERWIAVIVACVLLAIPLSLSVLGYFEGQLKTR